MSSFEVRYPDAPLGAEILGLDLARGYDAATFEQLEKLFDERGVICLRDQQLTIEQQIEFSGRFGEVVRSVNHKYALRSDQPEILVISNIVEDGKNIGIADAGQQWHTDSSYYRVPTRCSILYALEVPHDAGGKPLGDTLFASMTAAYDELPDDVKQRIDGLYGVHNFSLQYERRRAKIEAAGGKRPELSEEDKRKSPDMLHPIARRHPRTGKKCVYVNTAFTIRIEGLDEQESKRLCDYLIEFATAPRFIYTHKWRKGDLLMWDNCSTQHFAVANYALPQRRLMYRTTVCGTGEPGRVAAAA